MSLSDIKKNMPEMKRKELIAYDKWLTRRKWGTGEIISPEKAADLYLAEHPLPPAEGAEEILKPFCERDDAEDFLQTKDIWNHPRISDRTDKESYEVAHLMAEFAQEFATLHAQKIADKMKEANQFILDIAQMLGIETDGVGFDGITLSIDDFSEAADKMVEERLKNAPKNCPKAAQCAHVEGGMKCPPNVICPI